MTEETKKKDESIHIELGLGGLFKGLSNLIDAATNLAEKGEELSKTGDINLSGLKNIKGLHDLKGVYGIRVSTLADGRPSVKPFGNIKKTPKGPVVNEVREPMVDLFEEAGELYLVAEMPGIEENDIQLEIKGDILDIRAEHGNRKYQKEVLLSRSAKAESMSWTYKNGILEIRIRT